MPVSSPTTSTYNAYRWYDSATGRYERPDPARRGLFFNGREVRQPRMTPAVIARVNTMRTAVFGSSIVYTYAEGNPAYWVDPLGLAPCSANPALSGCREPGSGCCVASCIDQLRVELCNWNSAGGGLSFADGLKGGIGGAGLGAGFGALFGPEFVGPGACIGGGVGFGLGLAANYLGLDKPIPTQVLGNNFRDCMHTGCGVQCQPDKPCFVDDLLDMTINGN